MKRLLGVIVFVVFLLALCAPTTVPAPTVKYSFDVMGFGGLTVLLLLYVAVITVVTVWVFTRLK